MTLKTAKCLYSKEAIITPVHSWLMSFWVSVQKGGAHKQVKLPCRNQVQ